MTKMRMPEMNTVRFAESDVIVASLYAYGFTLDNTKRGDGYILFNNTKYGATGEYPTGINQAFADAGYGMMIESTMVPADRGTPQDIPDLFESDLMSNPDERYLFAEDGYYYWDNAGQIWRHQ